MKYYSEELNKLFNTEDELLEEEFQVKKAIEEAEAAKKAKEAEKETRYNELKEALELYGEAKTHYEKLLKAYTKDFGPIAIRSSYLNPFWFM